MPQFAVCLLQLLNGRPERKQVSLPFLLEVCGKEPESTMIYTCVQYNEKCIGKSNLLVRGEFMTALNETCRLLKLFFLSPQVSSSSPSSSSSNSVPEKFTSHPRSSKRFSHRLLAWSNWLM